MNSCVDCLYFVQEVKDIKKIYVRKNGFCLLDKRKHKTLCRYCKDRNSGEEHNIFRIPRIFVDGV